MNQPDQQHPYKSKHFFSSMGYALQGIRSVILTERNFRAHMIIAVLVAVAAWFFEVSLQEWAVLALCMAMMMTVEALNTSLEYLVDMLSGSQYSEKAKAVKDISAGACLISAIGVAVAGTIIFIPHLLQYLHGH